MTRRRSIEVGSVVQSHLTQSVGTVVYIGENAWVRFRLGASRLQSHAEAWHLSLVVVTFAGPVQL